MADLATATIDDMVAELKRRRRRFALAIDEMQAGNIPSQERAYYSSFDNPLMAAGEFCYGIQRALSDLGSSELSAQTTKLRQGIYQLYRLTN